MRPGQQKALIMSGMYSEEVSDVLETYAETRQPKAAFARAGPENLDLNLGDLVEELWANQDAIDRQQLLRIATGPVGVVSFVTGFSLPWLASALIVVGYTA